MNFKKGFLKQFLEKSCRILFMEQFQNDSADDFYKSILEKKYENSLVGFLKKCIKEFKNRFLADLLKIYWAEFLKKYLEEISKESMKEFVKERRNF